MKIYMYVDNPDLGENEQAMVDAIAQWVGEDNPHAKFINARDDEWILGIELEMKNRKFLAEPLNAMHKLALKYKCDFVVGYIEDGEKEDVCYFGKEEGKPDLFEIGSYLGFG